MDREGRGGGKEREKGIGEDGQGRKKKKRKDGGPSRMKDFTTFRIRV